MKQNLILFSILLLLVGTTYIFQEKRVQSEREAEANKDRLVNEEVIHLKLSGIDANKKNGQWWHKGKLLSHNSLKLIEKKLTEIKKIKDIHGSWNSFFSKPFVIEINHVTWTFGDMSLDKQGFYVAKDNKIYLAVIEGESTQLTQNESEIAEIKLNELTSLLSKNLNELLETQLFRFFLELPMQKIVVNVEGSLPFELNFEKNLTLPAPVMGIESFSNLREKFYSLLTLMSIKEELIYSEKLKFKKLGEIKFVEQAKSLTLELWLRGKNSADAIVIEPVSKKSFLMLGGSLKLFFIQVQDYWDKKVIPHKYFKHQTRYEAVFTQREKTEQVVILNKEPMAYESKKFKIDNKKMEQLIEFIFNLGPKDQAERVSILSQSEKRQVLSLDLLRLEILGQELILWRKKEELIVVNVTQGFKAHFALRDENFLGTFEDVLK